MTRRKASAPPPQPRPAGYFTEPVRAWFGADWQPSTVWGCNVVAVSERSRDARAVRVAAGDSGSIAGLSKRSDALLAATAIARAKGSRG